MTDRPDASHPPSCAFILELTAKPGQRDDLLGKVRAFFDALAEEDGFLAAHVHTAIEEPDLIVAYEVWAIPAGDFLSVHQASAVVQDHTPRLAPHVAGRRMRWLAMPAAWGGPQPPS